MFVIVTITEFKCFDVCMFTSCKVNDFFCVCVEHES